MASRVITDISDFIFVEDTPEPADAIFLPGGTHAEQPEYAAALYRQAVDEKGLVFRTALIVCKAFHARRCLMLYQLAFPEVSFKVCPVPCYNITKENWYKTEAGIHRVLGELARCGHQFVGDIENYLL